MKDFKYFSELMPSNFLEMVLNSKTNIHLVPAGTGVGKSRYIMHEIVKPSQMRNNGFGKDYSCVANKNIAIVVNRISLKTKTKADYEKLKNDLLLFGARGVDILGYQMMAYQKTEEQIIEECEHYDILIADEAHYFVSDSWNGVALRLFNAITRLADNGMKLIMFTATPKNINRYLKYRGLEYDVHDAAANINWFHRMKFIATNKTIEQILQQIKTESDGQDKTMVFVADRTSKGRMEQKGLTLSKSLNQNVIVLYSQWDKLKNGGFKKNPYMQQCHKMLVAFEQFDEQIAVCNKAIDNGINILYKDVKHIILENQYDETQIYQMIGRKRFDAEDPSDTLTVWLTNEGNEKLVTMKDELVFLNSFINDYLDYQKKMLPSISNYYLNYKMQNIEIPNDMPQTAEEKCVNDWFNTYRQKLTGYEMKRLRGMSIFDDSKDDVNNLHLLNDELYIGYIRFQLADISKLTNRYEYSENEKRKKDDDKFRPTIVKNYRSLVDEMFCKTAKIEWRNKDIAYVQEKQLIADRQNTELLPYLESLLGKFLYGEEREAVQSKISFYFGCSKKKSLSQLNTINKFIADYGYEFVSDKKRFDKKLQTYWKLSEK